jgi:glucose/arabinose dehydrogenase/cytochrome c5
MTTSPAHRRVTRLALTGLTALGLAAVAAAGAMRAGAQPRPAGGSACHGDNGGITLSPGFCATVFADNLGHVRHMTVGRDGTLFVNTWSGRYFANSPPPPGGFLIALKDTRGTGRADRITRFGPTLAQGNAGGSGVALYGGYLYAETNDKIVRYRLPPGGGAPTGAPEVVLSGMPLTGDHPMHPFIISAGGEIFVDMGSATNACQAKNRVAGVPGQDPCAEKETRAGTWRYDANRLGQKFSAKERYISGLRNGEGLSFDAAGRLFATQHGRDQLLQNWPALYRDDAQTADLPAEELVELKAGADYGWPECYYDQFQHKLVLAPEYGGDGGKKVGVCASRTPPVAAFPGHWAPNDMTIYKAAAFPAPYRGGAYIAFHGSWNRAPAPQGGYNVVYQPLRDGKASGRFIVFADGFAGAHKDPGGAAYRPTGLAVGPDGALYISDDVKGRIWRVTYRGPAAIAAVAPAPTPRFAEESASPAAIPPENNLPVPPDATEAQVRAGARLFAASTCTGCHGTGGRGTPLGPDLTSGHWLWSDGSLAGIRHTIAEGVAQPKQYRSPMPPMGGAQLSDQDLAAISAYVWSVGRPSK